jgi:hypothetical protein
MARPGFNHVHWFDLPFDEGIVLGWLGQFSSGKVSFDSFHKHVGSYGPRIFKFYDLTDEQGYKALEVFDSVEGFQKVFENLNKRTGFYDSFEHKNNQIHFETNQNNLKKEKNNVNSKSNLSETQKQIAKYTSNKYKKQLKEMNNKLKKVNNNPKINVKEKVEMSPLFHKLKKTNQQKLNDNDIVDINSINNAKKLANRNHQKTQLDIIKSISVASKHTNFQSLSDNENSTLIQEKLKSEIKVSPNFKKNK